MNALSWLLAVARVYLSIGAWLVLMADAIRRRRPAAALWLVAPPALAWLGWRLAHPLPQPWPVLIACLPAFAWCAAQYRLAGGDWRVRRRRRQDARQVAIHLVLLTGAVVFAVPFAWLISTSLKVETKLMVIPPEWIPRPAVWGNYAKALSYLPEETRHGLLYLWNTVYLSVMNIIGVTLASSLVAYSFARLRWPGRDGLFLVLLSTMMLPGAVTMIPLFLVFRWLGWVDTLRPLWVPAFFGTAFNIFLLRQFFLTIPTDLEDAAKIDGCSYLRTYWSVMLPLVKPALAAVVILTFMGAWNNFMGPLIYVSSPEKMPLAYALQLYQSAHGSEFNLLMAGAVMVVTPVILLFFFTQRYFIQGVTLTGIKG